MKKREKATVCLLKSLNHVGSRVLLSDGLFEVEVWCKLEYNNDQEYRGGVTETFIKKIRPTFSYCALFFKWIQVSWENNPINPGILEKALNNYDVRQIIKKK